MQNPEKNWFGEKTVSPEEKTGKVISVFDSVADRYDIMNDIMSGGIHRLWKDRFIRIIRPRGTIDDRPVDYLDVAGGTGDIAFRIRQKTGAKSNITLCDINDNMLSVGRNRAIDRGWHDDFRWVTGNAESLPIPDSSIDIYTIAFGLRNVTHIDTALKEAYRVLRPGGKFFCLEFSHVRPPVLAKAYDAYSYAFIPFMGEKITQDRESYQYLVESIRKFPNQQNLMRRIKMAGFEKAEFRNFSAGIAAVHTGFKH